MYKLLLCWRYLRTRYIALASIISVTLGVATMIVVNSVMEGFGIEMRNRMHGIYSDLIFAARSFDGMPDAAMHEGQSARSPATTSRRRRRPWWPSDPQLPIRRRVGHPPGRTDRH